ETHFTDEGVAIGVAATRPADFTTRVFHLSDALQWSMGDHHLKVGVLGELEHWEQDYVFGSAGVFTFGSLDQFAQGVGSFYQASTTGGPVSFDVRSGGVFAQDTWRPFEGLELRAGLRFDIQDLPSNAIALDSAFAGQSGFVAATGIRDGNDVSPRAGFTWMPDREGLWRVQGGGGFFYHGMDLALFSEAALYDGGVTVRRVVGDVGGWPAQSAASVPFADRQLTLFRDSYQNPRTGKLSLDVSRLVGGVTVEVSGNYFHTDYLPRRTDLNLAPGASGSTQEGRAVFGTLVKQGGSITVQPGTNRAIPGYDLVQGIAPTGFADYYGLTLSLERIVAGRLR
ncbi:MAG: TonB-dependent receptor domain-containing protein, partial [Gemmatimonadales bacterium]